MKQQSGVASRNIDEQLEPPRPRVPPPAVKRPQSPGPAPLTPGWLVVRSIDEREHGRAVREWRRYWQRHSARPTREERKRIIDGNLSPLERPLEPTIKPGEMFTVSPRFRVEVEEIRIAKRGVYKIVLGAVDDQREGRVVNRQLREDPDNVTTMMLADPTKAPPEPPKVPDAIVSKLPTSVKARERFEKTRRADQQRIRIDQLSARLRSLHKRAERSGVTDALDQRIADVEAALDRVESVVLDKAA